MTVARQVFVTLDCTDPAGHPFCGTTQIPRAAR